MGNYASSLWRSNSSIIRQNFAEDSETMLNELINYVISGSYACQSMAYYFDRVDIGLFGMADFCRFGSNFTCETSKKLMDYMILRGGKVSLITIPKPETDEWGTSLNVLQKMLEKLKNLYSFSLKVHENANNNNDANLTDFLETEVLGPVKKLIRELVVLISNLSLAEQGLGEYEFNKDIEKYLNEFLNKKLEESNVTNEIEFDTSIF